MVAADLTGMRNLFATEALSPVQRALRLRLGPAGASPLDGLLLVQRIDIAEQVCGGIEAHLICVSPRADLPLEAFLGQPAEVQIVTDRGGLQRVCAIVTEVSRGHSDGSLCVWRLTARDALSGVMSRRVNSRVWRNVSAVGITEVLLKEWLHRNPALARAFDFDLTRLDHNRYPEREFTFQYNEDDAAFLHRLWKRAGIAWCFEPIPAGPEGSTGTVAMHRLVLFDDGMKLPANAAPDLRCHHDQGTAASDVITLWAPALRLIPGKAVRASWDHEQPGVIRAEEATIADQGDDGNALAAFLKDSRIEMPHAGDSFADHARLTRLRMQRHEFEAHCVHGESGVRTLAAATWARVTGAPHLDGCPPEQREYLFIEVVHRGDNNLPKDLDRSAQALLAASDVSGWNDAGAPRDGQNADDNDRRYRNRFVAVRRNIPIVPAWNPRDDLPPVPPLTALVVGPEGEEVWCDDLGRVKVQFQGLDRDDHAHTHGAGTSGSDRDSAWVRVDAGWAGPGYGMLQPLRVGMEVEIGFLGGDPDRPVITGIVYNAANRPPGFSHAGGLPGNRYLSGIKTKEVFDQRYNQLRFDDTPGQISAQLASEHARSELNLGHLTHPRTDGRGAPRGEGAELRSDGPVAARGGQGVYLTAQPQPGAGGNLLERSALLGLTAQLQEIARSLGDLAAAHHAESTDVQRLQALVGRLKDWDAGSNVAPDRPGGGAPMVAVDAPAGIALASGDGLLLGAQTHLDAVSAGNTQLSAGRRLLLRAAEMFSAFAHKGIKLIAAEGKVELGAHQGNIELTAAKRIVLTAGEEIVLQAPRIRHVAQGVQVDLQGGTVTQQSTGAHQIKASAFNLSGPGGGAPDGPKLPSTEARHDQQVVMRWAGSDAPMKHQRYRITTEDGQVIEGRTDDEGRTERFGSETAFGRYDIEPLDD